MYNIRYPKIHIRSKNELAKHISHKKFSQVQALNLINDVLVNYNLYWKDNKKRSEPDKGKYVRNAKNTPLGILIKKIDRRILSPHDHLLPNFVFGGVTGRSHAKAARFLLGKKRNRTLLKLDLKSYFEQVDSKLILDFFQKKCQCSEIASKILSQICCIPIGPKGTLLTKKTIARGFATSTRLSVWSNLHLFTKLNFLIQKRLKGYDPRLAIYIDDIEITASRVSKRQMDLLYEEIKKIFLFNNFGYQLILNDQKKETAYHYESSKMEVLGIHLERNRLTLGKKSYSKRLRLKEMLRENLPKKEKQSLRNKYHGTSQYKKYVENLNH